MGRTTPIPRDVLPGDRITAANDVAIKRALHDLKRSINQIHALLPTLHEGPQNRMRQFLGKIIEPLSEARYTVRELGIKAATTPIDALVLDEPGPYHTETIGDENDVGQRQVVATNINEWLCQDDTLEANTLVMCFSILDVGHVARWVFWQVPGFARAPVPLPLALGGN